ncbi:unnamed protein product [Rotaria socialis]|uniref:Uncharacterized protein n=1 Tax=Rotaria socialis TaxID=392032 RepID=A0A818XYF9_9BILA|nr:unnamed protein product [Rotaria socialis]CAF3747822.1 unnamed protein product [Rotaria socialis]
MTDHTPMDSNLNDENIDQCLSRSESTDAVGQPCTNEYPTSITDVDVGEFIVAIDGILEIIKDGNRLSISSKGHLQTDVDESSTAEEETIISGDQYQLSAEPLLSLPDTKEKSCIMHISDYIILVSPASSTETNINSLNTIMGSATTNDNTLDMGDRINKIISDYKKAIQKNHLQLRHLTTNELSKLMERLCQEISPDTLELFRNEHFNDDNNTADNTTQELEKFYEWMPKYLTEQDLKLEVIIRSKQEQQQNLSVVTQALLNQNEQIFQQIQAQPQQLTQMLTWQQQQQANNQNAQSINNFNQNSPQIDQSDKQKDYFDTLVKLASTTILLWTMVALVKRS